jgi:hypothetical protein
VFLEDEKYPQRDYPGMENVEVDKSPALPHDRLKI